MVFYNVDAPAPVTRPLLHVEHDGSASFALGIIQRFSDAIVVTRAEDAAEWQRADPSLKVTRLEGVRAVGEWLEKHVSTVPVATQRSSAPKPPEKKER